MYVMNMYMMNMYIQHESEHVGDEHVRDERVHHVPEDVIYDEYVHDETRKEPVCALPGLLVLRRVTRSPGRAQTGSVSASPCSFY